MDMHKASCHDLRTPNDDCQPYELSHAKCAGDCQTGFDGHVIEGECPGTGRHALMHFRTASHWHQHRASSMKLSNREDVPCILQTHADACNKSTSCLASCFDRSKLVDACKAVIVLCIFAKCRCDTLFDLYRINYRRRDLIGKCCLNQYVEDQQRIPVSRLVHLSPGM